MEVLSRRHQRGGNGGVIKMVPRLRQVFCKKCNQILGPNLALNVFNTFFGAANDYFNFAIFSALSHDIL